jgi:hypothetical protein
MDLAGVLKHLKKSFTPRKNVDFEEQGLHIELEPLTSIEEVKVLESLKNFEGSHYIEGLRRHSLAYSIKRIKAKGEGDDVIDFDLSSDMIEYTDESGEKKSLSKFLYMIDYLGQWPSSIIDLLFDAFNDMSMETDDRVVKNAKFEKFKLSEKPPEEKPENFKQIIEKEEDLSGLDENQRLQRKVDKELEQETVRMNQAVEEKQLENEHLKLAAQRRQ